MTWVKKGLNAAPFSKISCLWEDIIFFATLCSYLHTLCWIQILGCKVVPWCNIPIFFPEHMSVFHKVCQDVQTLSYAILKCRRDYPCLDFPKAKPQNLYHGKWIKLAYSSCKIYLYRTVPAVGLSSLCIFHFQSLKHHSFVDGFFGPSPKGLVISNGCQTYQTIFVHKKTGNFYLFIYVFFWLW